ncbi:TRAP transporter small permease [Oceanimonas sp. NS1]|nr:TRAP transporter small permease [Oceanimonas sp. NS1]
MFLLVVLTFAGAALASRRHAHIRIELLEDKLPPRLRLVLYGLQWAASVVLLALIVWYGGLLTWRGIQLGVAVAGAGVSHLDLPDLVAGTVPGHYLAADPEPGGAQPGLFAGVTP